MAQDDTEPKHLIVMLSESSLHEAATMTLSHIARLRMPQPDDPRARAGETIVLTDEAQSFRVVAYIEATEQGFMLVNPLETTSTGRSYRARHHTPSGP